MDPANVAGLLGTVVRYKRCGVEPTASEDTEVQATECHEQPRRRNPFKLDGTNFETRRVSDARCTTDGRIRAFVCKPAKPSEFAQRDPSGDRLAGRC